ncbi:phycobiliprotein lyase [Calothrix sp. FACHB-1219]|uniref:phycobiliprotein lyase n=1 Tax=unclassified Calothrix TaxID=2619626 RepID=UPI0016871888|nr:MULTISPECIES: phycobiliprotein lyase [unclassified Calothrix]MBD2203959.1 phycobiliprotein lyase [Calothrix sp. FACHB-168]MBD2218256.1 phycobiliprotein lyase [Calothrix sp. FACHB-1219]
MDAMEFFQLSTGKWRSQRTTHHLAFKRSEAGESNILVEALGADHPKVIEICELHQVDPKLAIGGAFVSWQGAMGWDREDENHEGSTVFSLIPDADNPRQGSLLRERGYAEIVPVAGRYEMDEEDALVLITEYETMSSIERFWFVSPSIRMRTSTVKRFGGFSTATFCTEFRVGDVSDTSNSNEADLSNQNPEQISNATESTEYFSLFGW